METRTGVENRIYLGGTFVDDLQMTESTSLLKAMRNDTCAFLGTKRTCSPFPVDVSESTNAAAASSSRGHSPRSPFINSSRLKEPLPSGSKDRRNSLPLGAMSVSHERGVIDRVALFRCGLLIFCVS